MKKRSVYLHQNNGTMKILRFFCIIAMLALSAIYALGQGETEKVLIPLCKQGQMSSTRHRAPAMIPIAAEYDGFTSAIVVSFRRSVGDVTAEVMNLSTGEYASQSLDGTSIAYIPVPGGDGLYTVTFTLSSGAVYTGQFLL